VPASVEDVREGVIVTRMAAHAADIARGHPLALERDRKMSIARKNLDWEAQMDLAIDPKKRADSGKKPARRRRCVHHVRKILRYQDGEGVLQELRGRAVICSMLFALSSWLYALCCPYFPMQNWLKMRSRTSSRVVSPTIRPGPADPLKIRSDDLKRGDLPRDLKRSLKVTRGPVQSSLCLRLGAMPRSVVSSPEVITSRIASRRPSMPSPFRAEILTRASPTAALSDRLR